MTRLPDESINFQNTVGDSGVENLYVYGKLTYDFKGCLLYTSDAADE